MMHDAVANVAKPTKAHDDARGSGIEHCCDTFVQRDDDDRGEPPRHAQECFRIAMMEIVPNAECGRPYVIHVAVQQVFTERPPQKATRRRNNPSG